MRESPDAAPYGILVRLRDARRDFHATLTREAEMRERTFAPAQLLRMLRTQVEQISTCASRERCRSLFVLTVVLYGALDWQFAGHGIDIEADVQLERIRQNQQHGGPEADDRLTAEDWRDRLHKQVMLLERHVANEDEYAARLVKLTALAQAALEAASRQLHSQ